MPEANLKYLVFSGDTPIAALSLVFYRAGLKVRAVRRSHIANSRQLFALQTNLFAQHGSYRFYDKDGNV